jgi:hypothetical protein
MKSEELKPFFTLHSSLFIYKDTAIRLCRVEAGLVKPFNNRWESGRVRRVLLFAPLLWIPLVVAGLHQAGGHP